MSELNVFYNKVLFNRAIFSLILLKQIIVNYSILKVDELAAVLPMRIGRFCSAEEKILKGM